MILRRCDGLILLVMIVSSLFLAAHAQADAGADDEAKADLERFGVLAESREARQREAGALEVDAAAAQESDAVALRSRALELRLENGETLIEMGGLVEQMRSRETDVAPQLGKVAALMPAFWGSLRTDYDLLGEERDRLVAARAKLADAEEINAFETRIARSGAMSIGLLGMGVDGVELSERLGLPERAQRDWLTRELLVRARLSASHLMLAFQHQSDLADRLSAGADSAALAPAEVTAQHRIDTTSEILRSTVGLMDRLEIDATEYSQLLVESTGELTVEAIGDNVLREIISQWLAEIREVIASSGPSYLFAIFLFLLIMAVFYGLSRAVRTVVTQAVGARHLGFSELLKRTVISLSSGAVLALGLLIALSQLGIEIGPMLAGLGIAGFVIGFALQDTLANFAAGLMVLLYRPYDVGDWIDCAGGVFGTVSHMSLVSTTILTIDNKTLIVPNNKIWGDVMTNVTAQKIRRVDLEFGIGYGDDIPKAEEIMSAVLEEHPKILKDPEPVVKLHALGDSSVNFVVRPWAATNDYWDVHWDVTREIKLRFDREGVSIPFPQRDVHLYSEEPVAAASLAPDRNTTGSKTSAGSTSIDAQHEPATGPAGN